MERRAVAAGSTGDAGDRPYDRPGNSMPPEPVTSHFAWQPCQHRDGAWSLVLDWLLVLSGVLEGARRALSIRGEERAVDRERAVERTQEFVRERLSGEATGHDWWHVQRVWRTALEIGREEGADLYVVQLAALLHDVADAKFHEGDQQIGSRVAADWLRSLEVDERTIEHVAAIIRGVSFKGAGVETPMATREGMVVQDADRLDALGAIGIARAFAYGGFRGQPLHDPEAAPVRHTSAEEYAAHRGSTINHFAEKLLLLRDRMNTETARRIAEARHRFMEDYLREFFAEWDGRA
jgi:uncharacterized protein